ncbi:recombinase family protein [Nakamurella sp.]|uniref:recombinase family protein n=1 Tax=Nakamurella sp. TaxID=1869182 RepID=UPI003B3A4CFE
MDMMAAIYARISKDSEGDGLGVARQIADCTAEVARRGWTLAGTYVDNDVSATRSKVRPEYERMLDDVRAGRINALVVWDVDRLTRTPRELEDIIDFADRQGLELASIGGVIDLATPQGRLVARMKGSVARHETEQQSRRLKRKFQERAEAGKPHSFAAFGYRRRDDGTDELDPDQAEVIRSAAKMLLSGMSLRSTTAELNARGSTSPRGMPWASATLKQILLRDRNAGQRVHHGQVIGPGAWPAIYDQGTHERVVALLTDPNRKTTRGATRKHLLTGIARCGRDGCDGTMVVNVGRVAHGKRQPPAYVCPRCTRIRRKQEDVDAVVEGVIVVRLSRPDALAALAEGDPEEVERARDDVEALTARMDIAADQFADGLITGEQLARITGKLKPQIERARSRIQAAMPEPGIAEMVGPDAEARWNAAPLDVKRAVIELLCTVTILPSGPGKSFDPELIRIAWRTG